MGLLGNVGLPWGCDQASTTGVGRVLACSRPAAGSPPNFRTVMSAIIAVVKHLFCALAALVPMLAQQPTKIQALIITGQNGHDWRAATPVLRTLLESSGRFEVRVTEEFRGAGA